MMAQFWVFGQTSTSVAADQVSQSHVPLQWCLCQPQQAAGWPGPWQLCHHHIGLHQLKCLTFRPSSHLVPTLLAVHDIDLLVVQVQLLVYLVAADQAQQPLGANYASCARHWPHPPSPTWTRPSAPPTTSLAQSCSCCFYEFRGCQLPTQLRLSCVPEPKLWCELNVNSLCAWFNVGLYGCTTWKTINMDIVVQHYE